MFTGIVASVGEVIQLSRRGEALHAVLRAPSLCADLTLGDSVCVAGVCLTVTEFDAEHFQLDISPETLQRSVLSNLRPGMRLNLELALRLGDRLGGHLVLGHVDGTGNTVRLAKTGETAELFVAYNGPGQRLLVEKGSVTIDGVSLTIARKEAGQFSVALIPYTLDNTTIGSLSPGDPVNIEVDVIGRYVAGLLEPEDGGDLKDLLKGAWGSL